MILPYSWTTKRFDQLGTLHSGSTPSTANRSYWDGDIVWVTPNDLSKLNTPYLHDSAKCITNQGLRGCSASLLPPGSIVISSRAPIGYVAIPKVEFCTNQGCKSIDLYDSFDSEYTYYNIHFSVDKLKHLGEGTTFAEISKKALARVELVFPEEKPEQAKIAEVLSTVDRAIEQTEALIVKQQRIKSGLMQDLLTRGIDEHGNLRSEETHQFKDSPLGRIPVEWTTCRLRDCTDIRVSNVDKKFYAPETPVRLCNYMDVYTNDYVTRAIEFMSASASKVEIERFGLMVGDVVITKDSETPDDIGVPAVIAEHIDRLVCGYHLALIRPRDGSVDSVYLAKQIGLPPSIKHFAVNATGSTRFGLPIGAIENLTIQLAPENEQTRIAQVLLRVDRVMEQTEENLAKLRPLKTALMQDLLTGKVRVTSLLTEPREAGA